jgi:hypothetical protein
MPAYGSRGAEMASRNSVAYDLSYRGICLPAAFKTTDEQLLEYCNGIRTVLGFAPKANFE